MLPPLSLPVAYPDCVCAWEVDDELGGSFEPGELCQTPQWLDAAAGER